MGVGIAMGAPARHTGLQLRAGVTQAGVIARDGRSEAALAGVSGVG
jgi:hypothetical protein